MYDDSNFIPNDDLESPQISAPIIKRLNDLKTRLIEEAVIGISDQGKTNIAHSY